MSGMGSHEAPRRGAKDEWLTPPHIITALGPFDLDPCAPVDRPWSTAAHHLTIEDDGLLHPWHGLVWCNPPYGPEAAAWIERLAEHQPGGIALVFARTETSWFQRYVWGRAAGLLFLAGRIRFHNVDGSVGYSSAGAPSVLVAFGDEALRRLSACNLAGVLVPGGWTTAIQPIQGALALTTEGEPTNGNSSQYEHRPGAQNHPQERGTMSYIIPDDEDF